MAVYQRFSLLISRALFLFALGMNTVLSAEDLSMRNKGIAQIMGSVIATPCSIAMQNRYQTVDFSSLTLTMLSTSAAREQQARPFDIELRDCGSIYSSVDTKTWLIRFEGQVANNIDAFVLQGPSQGLGVSVLNNTMNTLVPGETYPLSDSILRRERPGQTLFLRYFLRLDLTGKPLQAGNYQGMVRFFIDYQ